MESAPWRRNQGGGIMEEESCRRHPGDTQEASRKHPGDPRGTQEAPRSSQEAPRRHPKGTQEAPRGTQEPRDILESECVISYAPAHKSDATDHFRVHGSDVTITKSAACAQDFVNAWAQKAAHTIPNTEDTPPEPLQQRLFGE